MRHYTFILLLLFSVYTTLISSGCGLFQGSTRKPRVEDAPPYYSRAKIERDAAGKEYANVPMEHSGGQREPYKEHSRASKSIVSSSGELEKLQREADEYAAEEAQKKASEKSTEEKKKGGFFAWFKSGKSTDGMSGDAKSISESLEAKRQDMVR